MKGKAFMLVCGILMLFSGVIGIVVVLLIPEVVELMWAGSGLFLILGIAFISMSSGIKSED